MTDDKLHWYVAYVKSCQEKQVAQALERLGYEYYLPIQKVRRKWSDRIKVVDKLVIPRVIFIHTTFQDRIRPLEEIYGMYKYITTGGPHTPAVVPDREMDVFMRMVSGSGREVTMVQEWLVPGDLVKVVDGPFKGMEVELVAVEGAQKVVARLGMLGAATVELERDTVRKIQQDDNK